MVDAGLDLGKTEPQSLELLRGHDRLAALGWPLFLSASNKRFLGDLVGTTVDDRREASHAAHALGHRARQPDPARPRRARRPAHRRRDGRRARRPRRGERMTDTTGPTIPITLLKGDDEVVLRDAVRLLVDDLVGDEDRALMVEEVDVGRAGRRRRPAARLVDAAQTPPLFTDVRVVLGRVTEKRERGELVQPLVDYLQDPLPSSRLVLEWRGKVPKALTEAIAHIGGAVVDTSPGRKVGEWVAEHLADAGLKVDSEGRSRLVTWVGDEPSRLLGLLDLLRSTYGTGAKITAAEIEPFLGDDGGVPPWDLTDAIDRGDRAAALELLQRMIGQGDRHPFQVLGTLHSHFARMLRLDGAEVTGEKEAAELLGLKGSTFPAKKALGQARRLGHERVVRADRPARRGRPRPARRQGLARPPRARGARRPPGHDVPMTEATGRHLEPQPPVPEGPARGRSGRLPLGARPRVRTGVPAPPPRRARRRGGRHRPARAEPGGGRRSAPRPRPTCGSSRATRMTYDFGERVRRGAQHRGAPPPPAGGGPRAHEASSPRRAAWSASSGWPGADHRATTPATAIGVVETRLRRLPAIRTRW